MFTLSMYDQSLFPYFLKSVKMQWKKITDAFIVFVIHWLHFLSTYLLEGWGKGVNLWCSAYKDISFHSLKMLFAETFIYTNVFHSVETLWFSSCLAVRYLDFISRHQQSKLS